MFQNPYSSGKVIKQKENFVGREDIVKKVVDSLMYGPIVLHGQRRTGKSSILYRLRRELEQLSTNHIKYLPVYIDLGGQLEKSLEKLLDTLAKAIRQRAKLNQLSVDLNGNPAEYFKNTWLPEFFQKIAPANLSIVLLLDECDDFNQGIPSQEADTFYKYLADLLKQFSTQIKIVMVLGNDPRDLSGEINKLLEQAKYFRVPLMSLSEIISLTELSKDTLELSQITINGIWQLTGGHPFLAQSICAKLWQKYVTEDRQKGEKLLIEQEELMVNFSSLEECDHIIQYAWKGLSSEEKVIVRLLASNADGFDESGIPDFIEYKALSERYLLPSLPEILEHLKENDWINLEKKTYKYTIKIPLFCNWLKTHIDLSQLINVLYDDQKRAFGLRIQAENSEDDLAAIDLLEKSLELNPDDEKALTDVVEKIRSIIMVCFTNKNFERAIDYANQLSKYNLSLGLYYRENAQANIQINTTQQKIQLSLYENRYSHARDYARKLGRYDRKLSSSNLKEINRQQILFIGYEITSLFRSLNKAVLSLSWSYLIPLLIFVLVVILISKSETQLVVQHMWNVSITFLQHPPQIPQMIYKLLQRLLN